MSDDPQKQRFDAMIEKIINDAAATSHGQEQKPSSAEDSILFKESDNGSIRDFFSQWASSAYSEDLIPPADSQDLMSPTEKQKQVRACIRYIESISGLARDDSLLARYYQCALEARYDDIPTEFTTTFMALVDRGYSVPIHALVSIINATEGVDSLHVPAPTTVREIINWLNARVGTSEAWPPNPLG